MPDLPIDLRHPFDAVLEGAIIRFDREHQGLKRANTFWVGPKSKISAKTAQPDQFLPLNEGRLQVLLGRNGSGKTRLFRGLRSINDDRSGYPSVTLLMQLPDESVARQWRSLIDEILASDWLKNSDADPDLLLSDEEPRLMSSLRNAMDGLKRTQVHADLNMPAEDLLSFFGFTAEELDDWEKRGDWHSVWKQFGYAHPAGPRDWSIRNLGPEFLLLASQSLPHNPYYSRLDDEGVSTLPAGAWFNSPELRDCIVPAVQEFLSTCTHVEIIGGGHFRILAPRPDAGPLRHVTAHGKAALEGEIRDARLPFPLGLFEDAEVRGLPFVASFQIQMWNRYSIDVVSISPDNSVSELLATSVHELTAELLHYRLSHADDGTSILITGISDLEAAIDDASAVIQRCDIGVKGLHLHWFLGTESLLEATDKTDGRNIWNDFESVKGRYPAPGLVWRDAESGDLLGLDQASDGQQQVMALFLRTALLRYRRSPNANRNRGQHLIVVGDEFDRTLHPTASARVLVELSNVLSDLQGVTALVSSHHVSSLNETSLHDVARIFAVRGTDGFAYSSSANTSLEVMRDVLGSDYLDALRLKRLHILVEGNHDEAIIEDLISNQIPNLSDVNIVNGRGLYGWSGIFANSLRFMDAPVLLVHDKQDSELEAEWTRCKSELARTDNLPRWDQTRLFEMMGELISRKRTGNSRHSDGELERLLWFLKNNAFEAGADQARRIHVFGLDCDDIVDLLPIECFPRARHFNSWHAAHEDFRARNRINNGEKFKMQYKINDRTVRAAIQSTRDNVHPELGRLLGEIRSILSRSGPS